MPTAWHNVDMSCSCCMTVVRLGRIEASISELLEVVRSGFYGDARRDRNLNEGIRTVANTIDQLRDELRDNTDAVSARIDRLIAEIQASGNNTASEETLADLQTISAHLRAMGTDPANPIPELPPVGATV